MGQRNPSPLCGGGGSPGSLAPMLSPHRRGGAGVWGVGRGTITPPTPPVVGNVGMGNVGATGQGRAPAGMGGGGGRSSTTDPLVVGNTGAHKFPVAWGKVFSLRDPDELRCVISRNSGSHLFFFVAFFCKWRGNARRLSCLPSDGGEGVGARGVGEGGKKVEEGFLLI